MWQNKNRIRNFGANGTDVPRKSYSNGQETWVRCACFVVVISFSFFSLVTFLLSSIPVAACNDSNEYIERHIITRHTHTKPFKCSYEDCDWRFSQKGSLTRHIRNTHEKLSRTPNLKSELQPPQKRLKSMQDFPATDDTTAAVEMLVQLSSATPKTDKCTV